MSRRLFISALLLLALAVPVSVRAAPMTQSLGSAFVTLTLDPDPPSTGTAHAIVTIGGATKSALSATSISFSSSMPSMNMLGANGSARRIATGRYVFDLPLGMAATWSVAIRATGGINGTATFTIPVASSGSSAQSTQSTGMALSGGGDVGPWRTAAFVLLGIVIVLAFVSRRVRTSWAVGVLGVAGAVAIVVAALQVHVDAQPGSMNGMDMNAMSDVKGDAPVTVRTLAVTAAGASADPNVFAPGTLAPYLLQDVVARSSGVLEDFSLYAGDRVKAGQVLAHLSEPELAARAGASSADAAAQAHSADAASVDASSRAPANVIAMQAAAAATKLEAEGAVADLAAKNERRRYWASELTRERTLLHQGAVSQQEFQDERAQAAAADAEATMAKHRRHATQEQYTAAKANIVAANASAQIAGATAEAMRAQAERAAATARVDSVLAGYTTVVAPMAGVVLKRMVDPGTYVQAGTVIARIAVVDRLRLQANIADGDLPSISIGTPVSAKTSDGTTLHGRVSSVAPVADPATRSAVVEAIVENPRHRAVPGGYVRVVLAARSSVPRKSMRIPSPAIIRGTDAPAVWRVIDRSVERVAVRIVSDDGRNAYVTGNLHSGDHIVVDGATDLQQGVRVSEASS